MNNLCPDPYFYFLLHSLFCLLLWTVALKLGTEDQGPSAAKLDKIRKID